MSLTRLDVVNDMLACLGELPMNSLEEGHPLAPTAIRVLTTASAREQGKVWWYNQEITDLYPDTDKNIYVPNDTLKVDPLDQCRNYVQRGRRLYKPMEPTLAAKWEFDAKVRCLLLREVPFDDCPVSIQFLISYSAQLDFMKSYEADAQKYQQVQQLYMDAMRTANSEHTRSVGANMLRRRALYNSRTTIGRLWEMSPGDGYLPHS